MEITSSQYDYFCKKFDTLITLCKTKAERHKVYKAALDMNYEMEYWESRCKEHCCYDWSKYLTVIDEDFNGTLNEFAFIVQAVKTNCYKNELRYPIVSAYLFTPEHTILYQNRNVALILCMDIKYLIGMSSRDSTTAMSDNTNIFSFPDYIDSISITSTFDSNDLYYDFKSYVKKLIPDDTGELTFGSKVDVQAVLYFDGADYKDIKFAESYARIYNLPILRYRPKTNIVDRVQFML